MQDKFSRTSFLYFLLSTFYLLLVVAPSSVHAQYVASDLLGHLDSNDLPIFTTSTANNSAATTNARGFSNPRGVALDLIRHRLFVADRSNVRVLVFNLNSNNDLVDRVADYVLGQTTFASTTTGTTQSNFLSVVQNVIYDSAHDRLFVADSTNNRILVFDVSVIADGMNASYVLGQPTFTSSTASTTQSGMSNPTGGVYDQNNNRLFIADTGNNRVLVYDVSSITNGEDAIYVLGQPTFTTSTASTTQSGMSAPNTGLAYDDANNRLFVPDTTNKRVLIFDVTSSTMSNGKNASYVLGQSTFTSSTSATTQNGFIFPSGMAYDAGNKYLFIADFTANRALVYDVNPITISNGQNAVAVLGQINFTSSTAATTQSGFILPLGIAYDPNNNRIFISDVSNHRVLIYNFTRLSTSSLASATADTSYSTTLSSTQSQGTVSYATTSGSLPPGLTLTSSTGAITGTPTTIGTYSFTIQATDNNGAIGSFVSQPQSYSITVGPAATVTVGNNNYAPAPVVSTPIVIQSTPAPTISAPIQSPTLTLPSATIGSPVFVPLSFSFTQNLKVADKKSDVQSLQQYLNAKGFILTPSGPGSPGNETSKFGAFTYAALVKFQEAHANEILTPAGLTKGTGYFGPLTRAYVNAHN